MSKLIPIFCLFFLMLSFSNTSLSQESIDGFKGKVFDFSIHNNKDLIVFPKETEIILWSMAKNEKVKQYSSHHTKPIRAISFSEDGNMFASGGLDSVLIIWEMESLNPIHIIKDIYGAIYTLKFSENGKYIIAGGSEINIAVIDVQTGKLVKKLEGHNDDVLDIEVLNNNSFASTGADGKVIIRNLDNFDREASWQAHKSWVRDMDYENGLDYLVTVADDGKFKKWSIKPESMGYLLDSDDVSYNWLTSIDIIEDEYYNFSGHNKKVKIDTPYGNFSKKVGSIINKSEIVVKLHLYTAIVATMTKGLIILPMQD